MSLDVSLYRKYHVTYDSGKTLIEKEEELFKANITHNLTEMADKAGLYKACWRPEELGIKKAKELIPYLEKGYKKLKNNKNFYKQFDADNGWGTYDNFLPWVKKYLDACKEYPEAYVNAYR